MSWIATVGLVTLECWYRDATGRCGRYFGITDRTHKWMQEEGGTVHCPAGHRIHYAPTELSKLREQLTRERAEHDQTRADRDRIARAEKKLARRIAAGVCPHCPRTFQNVARHMKSKHAEKVPGVRSRGADTPNDRSGDA